MIRKHIKEELIQVLYSLMELHHEGLVGKQEEYLFQVLQDCQEAAISIGNIIENNTEMPDENISILEEYCESLYLLSLTASANEDFVVELDGYIQKVLQNIEREKEKLLVVFLPY